MGRIDPEEALLRLARSRAGVLTRADLAPYARHSKAVRRWIRGWVTMAPGYFCLGEPTWLSWCWAGLLRAGATGVLTGRAAGHLHGFVAGEPGRITIHHQHGRALRPMGDGEVEVQFRRGGRDGRHTPSRTSVETALLDLAGESTEDETVMAATRALAQNLTTPRRILEALGGRGRASHRSVLEQVCREASSGIESVLEWRFLELVVRAHRLPEPDRQVPLLERSRSDNVWETYGLVAELDGHLGHEDRFRDMRRDNRVALLGLTTLRYGWHDVVERPCDVVAEIATALRTHGWQGTHRRCHRCPPG